MLLGSRGSRIRCLFVWIGATCAVAGLGLLAAPSLQRSPRSLAALRATPIDVALTSLAAWALLGCAVWLWLVTTIVVGSALRGVSVATRPPRGVPAGVRRVVLAACGVALTGGLAAPSYAEGIRTHPAPQRPLTTLSGLPLPDRAVSTAIPTSPVAPATSTRALPPAIARTDGRATRATIVRPGDSLWSIAADDLRPESSDAAIAARWHAIYAANRSLIGPDPDVLAVGQQLRLPGEDVS